MKISVEAINGKKYTVVWHGGHEGTTLGRRFITLKNGTLEFFKEADCIEHIATALPALPRHPKPEDAGLLYRYMAEGVFPYMRQEVGTMIHIGVLQGIGNEASHRWQIDGHSETGVIFHLSTLGKPAEIVNAMVNGNRVEIAIEDEA